MLYSFWNQIATYNFLYMYTGYLWLILIEKLKHNRKLVYLFLGRQSYFVLVRHLYERSCDFVSILHSHFFYLTKMKRRILIGFPSGPNILHACLLIQYGPHASSISILAELVIYLPWKPPVHGKASYIQIPHEAWMFMLLR